MSKTILKQPRKIPKKKLYKADIFYSLCIIVLGAGLGYISKRMDSISIIGQITTELGIWVFAAAIVAAYSRKPIYAAANVVLFFLAMLGAYYAYGKIALGFFPKAYFMGWLAASFASGLYGFVVWFSKGKDIIAILASAAVVSILYALGYPAFYTYKITLFITLFFGVILNILLPHTKKQKLIVFVCSIILAVLIAKFHLISYLPF